MSWERKYGREDIDYETWYNDWSKLIARTKTLAEIKKDLGIVDVELGKATARAEHKAKIECLDQVNIKVR